MTAVDDKTFRIVLKEPFGLMLKALAKSASVPLFVMPKRVAETPISQQISDTTGSGPFIFKKDEWKPGEKIVYVRNPDYMPRTEPPSGLAGGKVAKLDRIEWVSIPDTQTAINALLTGEIDMIEAPAHDLLPVMEKDKNIEIIVPDTLGTTYILRFNWKQPPFDDVRYRRAAEYALNQTDFLKAAIGDPRYYKACKAMFGCGTPFENHAGMEGILESQLRRIEEAPEGGGLRRHADRAAADRPTSPCSTNLAPVAKTLLERGGFKVDMQSMDWQTLVTRRAKKDPVDQGGWNISHDRGIGRAAARPDQQPLHRDERRPRPVRLAARRGDREAAHGLRARERPQEAVRDRREGAEARHRPRRHRAARPVRPADGAAQDRQRQPALAGHGVLERREEIARHGAALSKCATCAITRRVVQAAGTSRGNNMTKSVFCAASASGLALAAGLSLAAAAALAQAKHYKLAYDQPVGTGYGIVGNIFADKLKELSKGTMLIDQYPGAQLGQEPQVLQLVKSGDIEFCFSSSANAATLSPQAGVMSLHFLFRDEDHLKKSIASPEVVKAVRDDDRRDRPGRPRAGAADARLPQHLFARRKSTRSRTSRA